MKEIFTEKEVDQLLSDSYQKPVLILKHSTTCPISANAFKAFQQFVEGIEHEAQKIDFAMVKVIESRPASLYLADKVGVKHQSPQVLLIENGSAIWDDSHWQISTKNLAKAVDQWEKR